MKWEPIYMDRAALKFLRDWPFPPAVLEGRLVDEKTYDWLYEAHIIATPRREIGWPCWGKSKAVLSNLGYELKAKIDNQSFNQFSLEHQLSVWPAELLALRRDDCAAYLKLFQLTFNDQEVRQYISARLAGTAHQRTLDGFLSVPSLFTLTEELSWALAANLEIRKSLP